MKKFLYSLLLAIPMLGFVSCSDDDNNLPDVDFSYEYEGAQLSDGKLYVAQGEAFEITSINVKNNEQGKGAGITAANYYWDGQFIGTVIQPPFGCEFQTSDITGIGEHEISIFCPVYAVGKEVATAHLIIEVEVVASPEDLPVPPTGDDNDNPETPANPEVPVNSSITPGGN